MPDTSESRQPAASAHEALEAAVRGVTDVLATDDGEDQTAWLRQMQQATTALGEALARHVEAAEKQGGALDEILAQKAALEPMIARQKREHEEMSVRCHELETETRDQLAFRSPEINTLRLEARIVAEMIELHVLRGNALPYEAFFQQEGGEEG